MSAFRLSPKPPSMALGILAALVVVGIGTGIVAALETEMFAGVAMLTPTTIPISIAVRIGAA